MPANTKITKRTRNPRGQGGHLREEIVLACIRLLDQSASELTLSLRSIAKEAGIAAPSISRHFHDVHEIIDTVIARELNAFLRLLYEARSSSQNPRDQIIALVQAYVNYGIQSPSRYRVLFSRTYSPDWNEDKHPMVETSPLMAEAFAIVTDTIQECINIGISTASDTTLGAVLLWYGLHGLITLRQSITSFPWPDLDVTVDRILRDSIALSN